MMLNETTALVEIIWEYKRQEAEDLKRFFSLSLSKERLVIIKNVNRLR